MVIHLGGGSRPHSSGLPDQRRAPDRASQIAGHHPHRATEVISPGDSGPIWPCTGWGLPSRCVTATLVRSYRTFSPLPSLHWETQRIGGMFSVALSVPYGPWRYQASYPAVFGLSSALISLRWHCSDHVVIRQAISQLSTIAMAAIITEFVHRLMGRLPRHPLSCVPGGIAK